MGNWNMTCYYLDLRTHLDFPIVLSHMSIQPLSDVIWPWHQILQVLGFTQGLVVIVLSCIITHRAGWWLLQVTSLHRGLGGDCFKWHAYTQGWAVSVSSGILTHRAGWWPLQVACLHTRLGGDCFKWHPYKQGWAVTVSSGMLTHRAGRWLFQVASLHTGLGGDCFKWLPYTQGWVVTASSGILIEGWVVTASSGILIHRAGRWPLQVASLYTGLGGDCFKYYPSSHNKHNKQTSTVNMYDLRETAIYTSSCTDNSF